MPPRDLLLVTVLVASVACGGGSPVAQTSKGVKTDKLGAPADMKASVAKRTAEVPKSTNPNERIAFIREGSIWLMRPDGSDATQLTVRAVDAADEAPALSPDGEWIAWSSPREHMHKIFVMSIEELLPKEITDGSDGGDTGPSWSPDGKRIAFMRGDPRDHRDLYITNVGDGTAPQRLFKGDDDKPDYAGTPSWSPDGKTIVFSADRRQGRGTTLWSIGVNSRQLKRLTPSRQGAWFIRDENATWSPDGKRIAFASNRHVTSGDHALDFDIYAINPDGSGLTRLTDDPGAATDPAYSPDGNRLIFTSTREQHNDYERELYVMAATGGKQQRITRDERPQNSAPSVGITQ